MTNTTLTVAKLKKFHRSPATLAAIAAVETARTEAARIRAHVESYLAPAFAAFEPIMYSPDDDKRAGQRIVDHADLWMSDDEAACARWFAHCDVLHAALSRTCRGRSPA